METFSALLALCEGNPPVTDVTGGFPSQRSVTRRWSFPWSEPGRTVEKVIDTPVIDGVTVMNEYKNIEVETK